MSSFKSIDFRDDKLIILDQTKLPFTEEYIETDDFERIAHSIERLEVRGAPAIGVAAAYALALAVKNQKENISQIFQKAFNRLASTRPTAVNLFWALNEMKNVFDNKCTPENAYFLLIDKAKEIHFLAEHDNKKILASTRNNSTLLLLSNLLFSHGWE